jgi:hypothetical protein
MALTHTREHAMKRNEYKPKSVAQPTLGPDTVVIMDAREREQAYKASLPLARKVLASHADRDKVEYISVEHGTINLNNRGK